MDPRNFLSLFECLSAWAVYRSCVHCSSFLAAHNFLSLKSEPSHNSPKAERWRFWSRRSETLRPAVSGQPQAEHKNEKQNSYINAKKFVQNWQSRTNPQSLEKKKDTSLKRPSRETIQIVMRRGEGWINREVERWIILATYEKVKKLKNKWYFVF
jgi:hypothetical protein